MTLIRGADIAHEVGDTARARALLDEAMRHLDRVAMWAAELLSRLLRSRAVLALDAGTAAAAVQMLGAAHAHRGSYFATFPAMTRREDAFVARARAAPGTEADAAWAEGEALDLAAAFNLVDP